MPINIAPTSNDTNISELLKDVGSGKIQLPDFQRSWTWDDNRIRGILASLTQGYPMGAIMNLQYGSESVRFKYRTIEGVKLAQEVQPEFLVLDGQQRLTSMWRSTCSKDPVRTRTEKRVEIERYYYLSINDCLDEAVRKLNLHKTIEKYQESIITDPENAEFYSAKDPRTSRYFSSHGKLYNCKGLRQKTIS